MKTSSIYGALFFLCFTLHSHVLDDVQHECKTNFSDLTFQQKVHDSLHISSGALLFLFLQASNLNYTHNAFINMCINSMCAGLWSYGIKHFYHHSIKPENYALDILAHDSHHGLLLEHISTDEYAYVHNILACSENHAHAYELIHTLRVQLLQLLSCLQSIKKYTNLTYRSLLQKLYIAIATLQKSEHLLLKTDEWFLTKISNYASIYNVLQMYDNQELLDALTQYYNTSTYPCITLIRDLIAFQELLRSINQHEYSGYDFFELRKKNLMLITVLQKIITHIEYSYQYQTEKKIQTKYA